MDAVDEPGVRGVVALWCSQGGKTELTLNLIGRHVEHDPAPILYMAEKTGKAEAFSKDRLATMIRDTPALCSIFAPARSRDSGNTILHKSFPGGHVTMVGSNSPADLSMRPIRVFIADEFAGYHESAGTEGDPLKLGETRTSEFWNRVLFYITSPRWKADRSEKLWLKSDQRRWFVPCPDCKKLQYLKWEQVHFKNDQGESDPEAARYVCEHCGSLWDNRKRWGAIRRGRWKATAPFRGWAGFHMPAWSVLNRRLEDIVEKWLDAQGDRSALQVVINTLFAEWWEGMEGEGPDENEIRKRAYAWNLPDDTQVPEGVALLTLGADTQADRVEYEVVGWAPDLESWSIRYGVIHGDFRKDRNVGKDLDELLRRPWIHERGFPLYIRAAGIDTGGTSTQAVYEWVKPRLRQPLPNGQSQFVFGLKGHNEPGRPVWVGPAARGKGRRRLPRRNLWLVGTTACKDHVAALLSRAAPGPGFAHFPDDRPPWYFEGLTSEHPVLRRSRGRRVHFWEPRHGRRVTEPWACRNYAYAVLVGIQDDPFLLDLEGEAKVVTARKGGPATTAPKGQRRKRRRQVISSGLGG